MSSAISCSRSLIDPAKDGTNWYVYCNNNPINYVDPLGLDSFIIYDNNADSGDGKHTMADEAEIRKKQLEKTTNDTFLYQQKHIYMKTKKDYEEKRNKTHNIMQKWLITYTILRLKIHFIK